MRAMGFFKRSEAVRKISARARYVDEDVHRVDVLLTSEAGETVTIDLSLDQTRKLPVYAGPVCKTTIIYK
jgi:hypothetical protein